MYLSRLQKYILLTCSNGGRAKAQKFGLLKFYDKMKSRPKVHIMQNIITHSVERLISRGLLTGLGVRTPKRWYIKEIKLTPQGKKEARKLLGEQQKLPLKVAQSKSRSPT